MAPTAAAAEAATTVDTEAEEEEELDCLVLLVELDVTCAILIIENLQPEEQARNSEKCANPTKHIQRPSHEEPAKERWPGLNDGAAMVKVCRCSRHSRGVNRIHRIFHS